MGLDGKSPPRQQPKTTTQPQHNHSPWALARALFQQGRFMVVPSSGVAWSRFPGSRRIGIEKKLRKIELQKGPCGELVILPALRSFCRRGRLGCCLRL